MLAEIQNDASEAEIVDSILLRNSSILTIFESRLCSVTNVCDTWKEDGVKASIEQLLSIHNTSVTVDFLRVILQKPKLVTLDVATLLLPLLVELLFEIYEELYLV